MSRKNTSGVPGISWSKDRRKWFVYARLSPDQSKKYLGRFVCFHEAEQALQLALEAAVGREAITGQAPYERIEND